MWNEIGVMTLPNVGRVDVCAKEGERNSISWLKAENQRDELSDRKAFRKVLRIQMLTLDEENYVLCSALLQQF